MKHLKYFEKKSDLEKNDYVVLNKNLIKKPEYAQQVGKLINIYIIASFKKDNKRYVIDFGSPDGLKSNIYYSSREEIEFYSKDKKDAELYILSQKYNL